MAAEVDEGVPCDWWTLRSRIDAASAQVPPLERGGEALDLPGDKGARRVGGAGGARHALNANLIFRWLKDLRFAPADAVEPAPVFLSVEIHSDEVPAARMASPAHGARGRVEIVLVTAHRLVVEGPFDADALGRLLSVLARP